MGNSIIIFASGNGSNAIAIHQHSVQSKTFTVNAIFCNNKNATILDYAMQNNIPTVVFTKNELNELDFLNTINFYKPQLIILAGFLLMIPKYLVTHFPNKIINIHPALLPKYGGAGMYGMRVHEAVFANAELETGFTIHFVNEAYDEGNIILQKKVAITKQDTPQSIANKVLQLEHQEYKCVIENILKNTKN